MKKLLLSAAVVATLFTACKKDEKKNENYFTMNGKTYNTQYGYDFRYGSNNLVIFASYTVNSSATNAAISEVDLAIDTLIDGNTYTLFSYNNGAAYDKTRNFADATVSAGVTYTEDGELKSGYDNSTWTSGTVTVKKSGSGWAFTYQLQAGDSVTVKGQYTGTLTSVNLDDIEL